MPEGRQERPINLLEIREKIDSLNKKLIGIVAERMALMPEVAKYKNEHGMPRVDLEREKKMIEACRALASEQNVNPDLVENIMKLLIEEAHRVEQEVMGK